MANEKRLVDADLLLQWVEKLEAYNMGRTSCLKKPKGLTPECVRHMICTMPKVDAVEVVHGHWVSLADCSNAGVYCSVCHKKVYKEDYDWCNRKNKLRSNYCPNCGADMRGTTDGKE